MAHLGTIGTKAQSASASSVAITLTAGAPVGSTVLVGIAWESAAGSVPTISAVTDTGGNSYSTTPDVSANAGTTVAVAVLRARVTTALNIGDSITVTITGGTRGRWAMQADAFDDVDASSPLDKTATSTPGSSASLSSGVTSATVQAHELVYCVFGFGSGRTVTVPVGWTGGAKVETSGGSGDRALQVIHKYVNATGTQEGTLTLSSASTYAGAIETLKFTPAEPPAARISQVKLLAPQPGDALLAKVSQVRFTVPQAVLGEVRVSQVRLKAPAKAGQPPYSGIKAARDGNLWDATIQTPEST
ncbi:hypothetical protein [Actinomadura bangladeshensis]|uniref:Uncharacterized protein n=1 Tax=Actinomadura bangladeshensis TaxID=453573 RepID=A0A6L9QBG5_9ACTN|nr:hypothetical protein [Actinomadura bangladeshensis]NEA22595.1 hypothetical protein [Actinomadura bangladeshensis]